MLSCLILLTALFGCTFGAPPVKPTFGSTYRATGFAKLPYAELNEPFEIYFEAKNKRSVVSFYHGLDVVYYRGDLLKYGTVFKISPEATEKSSSEKACFQVNGTSDDPETTPQTMLPDITDFVYFGRQTEDNNELDVWINTTVVGKKTNKYMLYVTSGPKVVPVRYEMMGYDSLLGSHYDKYIVEYTSFDDKSAINASIFNVPKGLKCGDFPGPGMEHKILLNPYQELFQPEKTDRYHQLFEEYKGAYSKKYKDHVEHEQRKVNFRHNVRFIHSTNRQKLSYRLAINHLADHHDHELKMMRGRLYSKGPNNGLKFDTSGIDLSTIPDSMDWRIQGAVTQVKDQAICGSCWSFGTTGTIEGAYFLKYKKRLRLSQQNLMDCSWGFGNNGCDGGEDFRSYEWIMKHGGLESEETYGPYLGQNGKCHFNESRKSVSLKSYTNVTSGNQTELKIALAAKGPISVGIDASLKSFGFYSDGVYFDKNCGNKPEDLDHSVLAVGYGTLDGEAYWLIKNSWSTYWGNNGYILISQKDNNCGVATDATFVTLG